MSDLGELSDYLSAFRLPTSGLSPAAPVTNSSAARDAACNRSSEFFDEATCRRLGGTVPPRVTSIRKLPSTGTSAKPPAGGTPSGGTPSGGGGGGGGTPDTGGGGGGDGRGGLTTSESSFPWWLILVAAGAYYYSQRR